MKEQDPMEDQSCGMKTS